MTQQGPPDSPQPDNPYGEPHAYEGSPYGEPDAYAGQPAQPGQPPAPNPYQPTQTAPPTGGAGPYYAPEPYPFGPYTYEAVPATFVSSGYAAWISRVGAYVIDWVAGTIAAAPLYIGYVMLLSQLKTTINPDGTESVHLEGSLALPVTFMIIGSITSLAFFIWNVCIRQGRTGATIGKSVLAIRTVSLAEGRPIGPVLSFVRYLCHIVDALLCGLGYLWPLWDSKNQTFADKIMRTVVINAVEPSERA